MFCPPGGACIPQVYERVADLATRGAVWRTRPPERAQLKSKKAPPPPRGPPPKRPGPTGTKPYALY
jgi:hypothetical protein